MNKYEKYMRDGMTADRAQTKIYTSPDEIQIGDIVYDNYSRDYTTVSGIRRYENSFEFNWANGNGSGWLYFLDRHHMRE